MQCVTHDTRRLRHLEALAELGQGAEGTLACGQGLHTVACGYEERTGIQGSTAGTGLVSHLHIQAQPEHRIQ